MKRKLSLLLAAVYFCGYAQESKELTQLKNSVGADVSMSRSTSNPNFISFKKPDALQLTGTNAQSKAQQFIEKNYAVLNLKSANDLNFVAEQTDSHGLQNVIYKQYYQGVPVYDGLVKFHFNTKGQLSSINGNTLSYIKVSAQPLISKEEAASIAKEAVEKQNLAYVVKTMEIGRNTLYVFPKGLAQGNSVTSYLAYEVEVTNKNDVREFVFVNAHTGELLDQFTGVHQIDRKLYETNTNANNLKWKEGDAFPGTLNQWQRNEVAVSEHVYNFFKNAFGYISYDDADHSMITINNNPNINCPNANWNGVTANYCTGTASDDVVAHEWGHAYTEYTSGLIYQYQSGALNESFSDVWGETIDLLNNYDDEGENLAIRTTTSCTESLRWKMGEDATAFNGAIRDMWNPNCNGDPSVVAGNYYYCGTGDSGGVHTNSGVPNRLYSLLVDGGTFNGYTISSIGFVKAAHLWWRAQSVYLTSTSDFSNFADALEASVSDLIGVNLQGLSTSTTAAGLSGQMFSASDLQNVKNAILAVKLRQSPVEHCGYVPILEETPVLCEGAITGALFTENWENGLGNWTVTNVPTNPSTWEARNWALSTNLPKGRSGKGIFGADPVNGNCTTSLQNGILRIESPVINFPAFAEGKYELAFNHYVATEANYDGGNIKYSLNGGAWTIVPFEAFTANPYNVTLVNAGNDNPLKGQRAYSGTDGGSLKGSWGMSVVDLSAIGVNSGSNIKFRFEMGTDGCNGNDGWYIDEIYVYNCLALSVENITKNSSIKVFPNPTTSTVTIQNGKDLKTAQLYNAAGQLVGTFNINSSTKNPELNLSRYPAGTYVLKVNSANESSTVKVIKK